MYFPPMSVTMPPGAYEALLAAKGVRLTWFRSHTCPCVNAGEIRGSAEPGCRTCRGYGTYWDAPVGPFAGLVTDFASAPSPIEPGMRVDDKFGQFIDSQPVLTLVNASPYNAAGSQAAIDLASVWAGANVKDIFCFVDASARWSTILEQGGTQVVPFQQNLSIAPTGAVTTWDPVNRVVNVVEGYQIEGAQVTLPPGYPDGTAYTVEFTSAPIYVAHKSAGASPHVRPFGLGTANLPRRFHIQTLDFWTRENAPNAGTSYPLLGAC
jgi:hypothetical protein